MSSDVQRDGRDRRPTPTDAPLVFDPAEPVSVEMVPVGPGGKVMVPVLVLGGVRVCVDAFSGDDDAADWWYGLGTAAMTASLCYVDDDETISAVASGSPERA